VRGAVLGTSGADSVPTLFTWGESLLEWKLPKGSVKTLVASGPGFGEGGCLADWNGDGVSDLVVLEAPQAGAELGRTIGLEAPLWRRHEIDTGSEFRDCIGTTLFGRRGILVVHRHAQIRFYMTPARAGTGWPYREIYSIYTPSHQAGLLVEDIDSDGNPDIFCGNYWIRSPKQFELPWRLFAINLWMETIKSGLSRLSRVAVLGNLSRDLLVLQSDVVDARLAWFPQPADATTLWPEHRLEENLHLRRPRAFATGDVDGDGDTDLVVGENSGPGSRLICFRNKGGGQFQAGVLATTEGLIEVWLRDLNQDAKSDIVGVGASGISVWENHLRK
jgi:hypothetical protein